MDGEEYAPLPPPERSPVGCKGFGGLVRKVAPEPIG